MARFATARLAVRPCQPWRRSQGGGARFGERVGLGEDVGQMNRAWDCDRDIALQPQIPDLSLREFILWLGRRRRRWRITDRSMVPTLQPGEEVLTDRLTDSDRNLCPGEIVVAWHPHRPNFPIIKRVSQINADGSCWLLGDNLAASEDSRAYGAVARSAIVGRVCCRFG